MKNISAAQFKKHKKQWTFSNRKRSGLILISDARCHFCQITREILEEYEFKYGRKIDFGILDTEVAANLIIAKDFCEDGSIPQILFYDKSGFVQIYTGDKLNKSPIEDLVHAVAATAA